MRVCHTMVVRPRCSGVHSARAVSPTGIAEKKLVLLSMVAVRAPSGKVHDRSDAAEVVGQRHDRPAVKNVGNGGELLAHFEFGFDAVGRHVGQLDPQKRGERRLKVARVSHDNVLDVTADKGRGPSQPFLRPRSVTLVVRF
jgi:hypothetical protein